MDKKNKETEGLQCLRCYSVVFTINDLIEHIIKGSSHQYWKYGDGKAVLFLKLLREEKNVRTK